MKTLSRPIFLCVTISLIGFMLISTRSVQSLKIGANAPDFILDDMNGKAFHLNHQIGKVVIMGFVGKADSRESGEKWIQENHKWLENLTKIFGDKVVIIGIKRVKIPFYLPKSLAENRLKERFKNVPYRLLIDWNGKVFDKYPSNLLFTLYVLDTYGKIAAILSEPFSFEGLEKLSKQIKSLMSKEEKQ